MSLKLLDSKGFLKTGEVTNVAMFTSISVFPTKFKDLLQEIIVAFLYM